MYKSVKVTDMTCSEDGKISTWRHGISCRHSFGLNLEIRCYIVNSKSELLQVGLEYFDECGSYCFENRLEIDPSSQQEQPKLRIISRHLTEASHSYSRSRDYFHGPVELFVEPCQLKLGLRGLRRQKFCMAGLSSQCQDVSVDHKLQP